MSYSHSKAAGAIVNTYRLIVGLLLMQISVGLHARAADAPVSALQVRVVTGSAVMSAGTELELRIYEAGKPVRRLSLVHGESWAHDSTHLISLALTEPLDPREVVRFALYYRAGNSLAPAWEVKSAEVDLSPGHGTVRRLLNATLAGTMVRQGELASLEREAAALKCVTDSDCDDRRSCNGREHCSPREVGADARGCVKGMPVVCPVNEVCSETRGCLGTGSIAPK